MTERPPRRSRAGVTFDVARAMLLDLPGVEEGPCYGTPGYRVRGKLLARIWPDLETLVVKCGDDERDVRMQLDPETYFVTNHYKGHPMVLVRLGRVRADELRDLLLLTWRANAPKTLVLAFDGGETRSARSGKIEKCGTAARSKTISMTRPAGSRVRRRPKRP